MRLTRSLLNGVGKVNKWLFGNHDSDDGDRYNIAIKLLQDNQKHITKEINLQTLLFKKLIIINQ